VTACSVKDQDLSKIGPAKLESPTPAVILTTRSTSTPHLLPQTSMQTLIIGTPVNTRSATPIPPTALPTPAMTRNPQQTVTTNQQWEPLIQDFNGLPMALVPPGCFPMGSETGYPHEAPVHEICFQNPFWIAVTEVTNAKFAAFLNALEGSTDSYGEWVFPGEGAQDEILLQGNNWEPRAGFHDDPAHGVNWFGANAYCNWLGGRLPTEAEWEYSARGPDGWIYPWGDNLIEDNVVRIIQLVPDFEIPSVGSKPEGASWTGALDMSSSLLEWVHSIYRPYPYDPTDGRETSIQEDDTSERILRSGSWYHNVGVWFLEDNITTSARFRSNPYLAHWSYGFRCVMDIVP